MSGDLLASRDGKYWLVETRQPLAVRQVEVVDHSIFDPTPESSRELRKRNWGLTIVDSVTDDWGRMSEGGIWAEFQVR